MEDVEKNLTIVRDRINQAAKGRDVTLVGVSKQQPVELIEQALACGLKDFGENKMQEWKEKSCILQGRGIRWHFLGKLQTNKIKMITPDLVLVQSLESSKQAEVMEKTFSTKKDILLQVNIGNEPQKSGILPENVHKSVAFLGEFDKIDVTGLMCIPPKVGDPKFYFLQMRDIFTSLQDAGHENIRTLSMGMSADYETAIHCGSTMVRVGAAIFGSRKIVLR